MEENQQNKQGGGKGILIIIALIVAAAAVYFIVQGVNKKDKNANQPTVSISEADKLELSALNLQGMWNKTVGKDKYELNFKSNKELVLTQYDANGEVAVKSDEGTYSVDNGVLNLTVVANGQTSTAAATTAVLSDKYLIITVTEGSELFAGTYNADRGDMPSVDVSGTENSKTDSEASVPESVVSEPESVGSTPVGDDNSFYQHLSGNISGLIRKSPQDLIAMSSTTPTFHVMKGTTLTINGYEITIGYINGEYDENGILVPTENSLLTSITIPCEMFFSYPSSETHEEIKGKQSYTYEELKAIYGDKMTYTYREPGMDSGGYIIEAVIDGYSVTFTTGSAFAALETFETPITLCVVNCEQQ